MHILDEQEMKVIKLCRKENITNIEKTTLNFISVASGICHYFFFQDQLLVMLHVDPV